MHADVRQPTRPMDKEPQSTNGRDRCTDQSHGCDCSWGDATQEQRGNRSPQRKCHQEHKDDGRKGIDRVMQDLGKKPCPEYLETETKRARTGSDHTQTSNPRRGDKDAAAYPCRACLLLSHSQSECSCSSHEARPSRGAIARAHANGGWEPEAHGNG